MNAWLRSTPGPITAGPRSDRPVHPSAPARDDAALHLAVDQAREPRGQLEALQDDPIRRQNGGAIAPSDIAAFDGPVSHAIADDVEQCLERRVG